MRLTSNLCMRCVALPIALAMAMESAPGWVLAENEPAPAPERQPEPLNEAEAGLVAELEAKFPADSEAGLMLQAILSGSQLGPGEGWFATAVSQSRFQWPELVNRFDLDLNGQLERLEFPGGDDDFYKLDRDHSETITDADLTWPDHALSRSPGSVLFMMADRDGNGRVSAEEFNTLFLRWDRDHAGFLSQDDFRQVLTPPAAPRAASAPAPSSAGASGGAPSGAANVAASGGSSSAPAPAPPRNGPSREVLLRGLLRQEIGSHQPGPAIGDLAPNFTLKTPDGLQAVELATLIGEKPVVLIFGNFTCGPFRSQAGNVEKLYLRYKDRVHFLLVYVREAHPTDGWHMESNTRERVTFAQPTTQTARDELAQICQRHLDLPLPMVVDTLDDAVGGPYSGMPSRLYVIDQDGKIAFKSGRGPFGFKVLEMEQALVWQLTLQDK